MIIAGKLWISFSGFGMNSKKHGKIEITEQLIEVEEDSVIDLDFVELLSNASRRVTPKAKERIKRVKNKLEKDFYPKVIWTVTQKTYNPLEAKRLWERIVKHKEELNSKLGRDVGISVATLDYMSNILNDLSEPKVLETSDVERMAETALTDELTGLYLRGVFDVLLDKYVGEFNRYERPVSLIIADIDDFKKVNDRYGHQRGDEVLRLIGAIFNSNARDTDIAVRYGGEELAIILPETEMNSAYELAERMRILVYEEFKKDLSITLSLGVANCPRHASSVDELVKAADDALYLAKAQGKNCAVIADKSVNSD